MLYSRFMVSAIAMGLLFCLNVASGEDEVAQDGAVSSLAVEPKVLREGKPEEVGISPERLARVQDLLRREVGEDSKVAPGAVLLVARKGVVVLHEPFGFHRLAPAKEPMNKDHVFGLASITKSVVTATSLMMLVEEGRLRLDDKASKFIPEFGCKGKDAITMKQLLTHSSGLHNHSVIFKKLPKDADRPAKLRTICQSELAHEPGTHLLYSCCNFMLLSAIVEKVSGTPLGRFAKERIFTPLGMKTARTSNWGNAGLACSARDLAVFAQTVLNGGIYGDVRILGPLTVRAMISRQTQPGLARDERGCSVGPDRGLGWLRSYYSTGFRSEYDGRARLDAFGHSGYSGVVLWVYPDLELIIVFLTNWGEHNWKNGGGPPPLGMREIMPRICNVVISSIVEE